MQENESKTTVTGTLADMPDPTNAKNEAIKNAVLAIVRKAHIASHGVGTTDFIYELAHTAITSIVGTAAVHDYEEWKSQDRLDWAINLLAEALKS